MQRDPDRDAPSGWRDVDRDLRMGKGWLPRGPLGERQLADIRRRRSGTPGLDERLQPCHVPPEPPPLPRGQAVLQPPHGVCPRVPPRGSSAENESLLEQRARPYFERDVV